MNNSFNKTQVTALPFAVTCVCLSVALIWGYDNQVTTLKGFYQSNFWSWITTHFTHSTPPHLFKNILALWLLHYLFPINSQQFITASMACIILVGFYSFAQDIQHYLGLSAILYVFPGFHIHLLLKQQKFFPAGCMLLILTSYLFLISPMSQHIHPPFTAAHLIGFISGFFTGLLFVYIDKSFALNHK